MSNRRPLRVTIPLTRVVLATAFVILVAAGAAATDDVFNYQFNAADQLGSVNLASASIGSFAYDGDGLRTRNQTDSETVFYLRDDAGNVIAEYDQNGALVAEYVYSNSQRVTKIEPGDQRSYYHGDIVGTPLVITDSSGSQSFRGEYRPFGTEEEAIGTRDRRSFTGKEYDGDFGLFYFNARYYDSKLGRFVSVDPIAGKPLDPQSWNRYAYALNSPMAYIDPTGRAPNKPATTDPSLVETEIRSIENSGADASETLEAISEIHVEAFSNRYFYTKKYGWVDIRHFGAAAKIASEHGERQRRTTTATRVQLL